MRMRSWRLGVSTYFQCLRSVENPHLSGDYRSPRKFTGQWSIQHPQCGSDSLPRGASQGRLWQFLAVVHPLSWLSVGPISAAVLLKENSFEGGASDGYI